MQQIVFLLRGLYGSDGSEANSEQTTSVLLTGREHARNAGGYILLREGRYSPFLLLSYNLFNVDCLYGLLSYNIHRHGLITGLGEVNVTQVDATYGAVVHGAEIDDAACHVGG